MLLNVREQTTALTMLCYEFFGSVLLLQESMSEALSFLSDFYYAVHEAKQKVIT